MLVFLFTYNRESELEVVLSSIEESLRDYTVIAIDDRSDNLRTRELLEESPKIDKVYQPKRNVVDQKCGGLYHNLLFSYRFARRAGFKYILCLSDDEQLLANLDSAKTAEFERVFEQDARVYQVDLRVQTSAQRVNWDSKHEWYLNVKNPHFVTFALYSIERMEEHGFVFGNNISESRCAAQKLGIFGVIPRELLVAKLPFALMYRKNGYSKFRSHGRWLIGDQVIKYAKLSLDANRTGSMVKKCSREQILTVYDLPLDANIAGRIAFYLYPDQLKCGGSGHKNYPIWLYNAGLKKIRRFVSLMRHWVKNLVHRALPG